MKKLKKFSMFRKKGKVRIAKYPEEGLVIFNPIAKRNSPAPEAPIGISIKRISDI
jgi:hypothetical protein